MSEIVTNTGYSRDAIWRALVRLQVRGNIHRVGRKKRRGFKKKRLYNIQYKLAEDFPGNRELLGIKTEKGE